MSRFPQPSGGSAAGVGGAEGARVIEVWRVHLDVAAARRHRLEAALSPAERERAARFRTRLLQHRYAVAHGALRCLLAERMMIAPDAVEFVAGVSGKPSLSPRHGAARPRFNLSHADDTALIAVSDSGRFGIDIEKWRDVADIEMLARRYLAASEARQILSLDAAQQIRAFLACWTRKEAYLKATGAGLSVPLDSFEVTVKPGVPARLVAIAGDGKAAADWSLVDLANADFAATLAVEGRLPALRLRRFQPGQISRYQRSLV